MPGQVRDHSCGTAPGSHRLRVAAGNRHTIAPSRCDIDSALNHAGPALEVGLSGDMRVGKTSVGMLLVERRTVVADGDEIGHNVLALDKVSDAVTAEFGARELAGGDTVNRVGLVQVVLTDYERLRTLGKISYPVINWELAVRDRIVRQAGNEKRRTTTDHVVVNDSDLTALTA